MATEALGLSRSTAGLGSRARTAADDFARRMRVHYRHWRRQQRRRHVLALVLAETSDPRLVIEAGCRKPGRSMVELWVQEMLHHR